MGSHSPHGHKRGSGPSNGGWAAILVFLLIGVPLIWYVLSAMGLLK